MASVVYIDFETRSECDLEKCGSHVYARHPSTEVLIMSYAFGDEPILRWLPGQPFPDRLRVHVESNGTLVGHNIGGFEFPIWNHVCVHKYAWPMLKIEQCICTMVQSYAMSMPGSLEKAAAAFGIEAQKDLKGSRVMLQLCKPKATNPDGTPEWYTELEYPEKFLQLYAYCDQDVEVERQLFKRQLPLSRREREVWLLDQKINSRGVFADEGALKSSIQIADYEKEKYNARIRKITKQYVLSYNETGRIVAWLKTRGIEVPSILKMEVTEALTRDDLPKDCRDVLLLRQEAAKSSTAKLEAMLRSSCPDGRIRGIFQYHGAGTGRWAGRLIQPQNFPRGHMKKEDIDEVFDILRS